MKEVLHNGRTDFLDEEAANVAPGSEGSGVPEEEGSKKKKKTKKLLTKPGRNVIMKETLLNTIKDIALMANDDQVSEKVLRVIRKGKKVKLKRPTVRKKGYKSVDGKNVKMSAKERMNRKKSQKKGAKKRRAKSTRANISRKKSMRKVK